MMKSNELIENEKKYMSGTYIRPDFVLEKGEGSWVWDKEGKKYLDLISGIATVSVGHANPEVAEVIAEQAKKLVIVSNLYYSEHQIALAEKLVKISGLSKCFFANSGAEAIETAIKLARKHTKKEKIIAMENCFHGRTMGALSATWNPRYKNSFKPLVPGFSHVPFNDIQALHDEMDDNTAAVIIEPIQGEAGIIIPDPEYLKYIETLCKEKGILLIFDEVQTGNGRTGKFFCFQHYDIMPDIVTCAKGIANGLPLSVMISKENIDFEPGDHATTFGGNSLCCVAALKVIDIIDNLYPYIVQKGEYFMSGLNDIPSPLIKEVRGKGLMIAVELNRKCPGIALKLSESGILINCIKDHILRFLPALTISHEQIDLAIEKIKTVIKGFEND